MRKYFAIALLATLSGCTADAAVAADMLPACNLFAPWQPTVAPAPAPAPAVRKPVAARRKPAHRAHVRPVVKRQDRLPIASPTPAPKPAATPASPAPAPSVVSVTPLSKPRWYDRFEARLHKMEGK